MTPVLGLHSSIYLALTTLTLTPFKKYVGIWWHNGERHESCLPQFEKEDIQQRSQDGFKPGTLHATVC